MNDSDFNAVDWDGLATSRPVVPVVLPGPTHFASVARWIGPDGRRAMAAPARLWPGPWWRGIPLEGPPEGPFGRWGG